MTARQQLARLLPLVLLAVLVIAGLRGAVPTPRWSGPLTADGVAIGIGLEVIFAVLLAAVRVRQVRARRSPPATAEAAGPEPPQALRFTLSLVLAGGMIAVAVALISDLHLHFLTKPRTLPTPPPPLIRPSARPSGGHHAGGGAHIPVGPILYTLLVVAVVAAVVVSIWWSSRLRRPAPPLVIEDVVSAEELRAAVAEGRAALAAVDDARAAIIACYAAMEQSLAERGTARGAADTPGELLDRAVAAGTVRGPAARRLTALFYEARFSSHPLRSGQREQASTALDALAAELAAAPAQESTAPESTAPESTAPESTAPESTAPGSTAPPAPGGGAA